MINLPNRKMTTMTLSDVMMMMMREGIAHKFN